MSDQHVKEIEESMGGMTMEDIIIVVTAPDGKPAEPPPQYASKLPKGQDGKRRQ
ncbi:hypothetical protein VMCG_05884 [Cytospora schulzeri]|uniref:Uncharacterized protein n=1 Tax=Cytospora schulzeri TaxID=448051 RepID=A0A423WD51_9PEZI|nr:hypothetical protein VMCG_05884 [Valsa malicola]